METSRGGSPVVVAAGSASGPAGASSEGPRPAARKARARTAARVRIRGRGVLRRGNAAGAGMVPGVSGERVMDAANRVKAPRVEHLLGEHRPGHHAVVGAGLEEREGEAAERLIEGDVLVGLAG